MTQLSILVYVAWSWKAATRLFKSCQAKDAQTGKRPPAWISARSLQGALSMRSQADSCQVVYYQHPAPACEMRKQVLTLQQPCFNCLRHTVPWKRPISPKPFSISLPWSLLRAVDKNPHTAKCRASVSPQSIEQKKREREGKKGKISSYIQTAPCCDTILLIPLPKFPGYLLRQLEKYYPNRSLSGSCKHGFHTILVWKRHTENQLGLAARSRTNG